MNDRWRTLPVSSPCRSTSRRSRPPSRAASAGRFLQRGRSRTPRNNPDAQKGKHYIFRVKLINFYNNKTFHNVFVNQNKHPVCELVYLMSEKLLWFCFSDEEVIIFNPRWYLHVFLLPSSGRPQWWRPCWIAGRCNTELHWASPRRWSRPPSQWPSRCPPFSESLLPEQIGQFLVCFLWIFTFSSQLLCM